MHFTDPWIWFQTGCKINICTVQMASTTKNLEVSQQYMKQLSQIRGMFSFLVPDDGEDDENDDR